MSGILSNVEYKKAFTRPENPRTCANVVLCTSWKVKSNNFAVPQTRRPEKIAQKWLRRPQTPPLCKAVLKKQEYMRIVRSLNRVRKMEWIDQRR